MSNTAYISARGKALSGDKDLADRVAVMLKALGHPVRLRLVAILCGGEEHVSGLVDRLGMPQSVVSQQLGILRMRGLVESRRVDGFAYYRLTEPRLRELVGCMEGCA